MSETAHDRKAFSVAEMTSLLIVECDAHVGTCVQLARSAHLSLMCHLRMVKHERVTMRPECAEEVSNHLRGRRDAYLSAARTIARTREWRREMHGAARSASEDTHRTQSGNPETSS